MAEDMHIAAKRALSMLDLTDLTDNCTPDAIDALCRDAFVGDDHAAAICIWPRFVAQARGILGPDSAVKIATVVNFPSGDLAVSDVVVETVEAIADGADEIDLVIPYRALLSGDETSVSAMVEAIREVCAEPVVLKTILETGELVDPALIRRASELAIEARADFIKTSTGKVTVNATPEAAEIMVTAIKDSGKAVGFKAAGGVRTVEDASRYLAQAEGIMGEGWPTPDTFRFGASGLLGDIRAKLTGGAAATGPEASY